MTVRTATSTLSLALVLAATPAAAQSTCFTAQPPERAAGSHLVVGAAARFTPSTACRYAVRLRGSADVPAQALSPSPRDLAEFVADLGAPHGTLAARLEVIAAPEASPTQVETLSLRPCVAGLGEGSTVARFDAVGSAVRIRPALSNDGCPVADAEVLFTPADTTAPTLRGALPTEAQVLPLAVPGEVRLAGEDHPWAVWVRRRGATVALRIDTVTLHDPRTALRRRFETPGTTPWLRADWSAGALRFTPDRSVFTPGDAAWSEMVSAAATGAVFVATRERGDGADVEPLTFDVDGNAARMPDALLRDAMRAHYGAAGPSMVPVRADWERALAAARLCHRRAYAEAPERAARVTAMQLRAMACVSMAQVATVSVDAPGAATLERHVDVLTTRDGVSTTQAAEATQESLPLEGDGGVRFVTPGDVLRAPASLPGGHALALCRVASDASGEAVTLAAGATHTFTEASAGLWQLVLRPVGEPGCTGHDLALARVAVIAPRTDWIPVGLQEHDAMDLRAPWRAVATSGDDTFAFRARAGVPEWRLATTAEVSAAVNGWQGDAHATTHDESPRLSTSLPVTLASEPTLNAPAPSALTVLLSRGEQCPTEPSARLANLRGLPSEAVVYAHLAARGVGASGGLTCLARARLRVVPPLVHRGSTAGPFYVRWGTPGAISARAHWEVLGACKDARCLSLGVAVPLVYARISPSSPGASWFGMEFSVPLVLAASPGDGRALHTGLGVDVAFTLGPNALPRLVSLGVLVQPYFLGLGPSGSDAVVDLAPYLGFNLNAVVDAIRSE